MGLLGSGNFARRQRLQISGKKNQHTFRVGGWHIIEVILRITGFVMKMQKSDASRMHPQPFFSFDLEA
jgi:hypothetical protein